MLDVVSIAREQALSVALVMARFAKLFFLKYVIFIWLAWSVYVGSVSYILESVSQVSPYACSEERVAASVDRMACSVSEGPRRVSRSLSVVFQRWSSSRSVFNMSVANEEGGLSSCGLPFVDMVLAFQNHW